MNCLIIYMSRHGTTEKVVKLLQEKLGETNCQLHNLEAGKMPELSNFDTLLIGGSIHVGQIQKEVKSFCGKHEKLLLQKKLGLFICFMEKEKGQMEFEMAFPEILRKHAVAHGLFGGELLFDKMNFIERTIIRKIKKVNASVSEIDFDAIEKFAASILSSSKTA
ncbi:MAG TPA: flavodoxin domain-containing protein [Cyclobacteriaceae bacterium]|nr:flavodoxin domain-containing protein [Cyclobacteriaceae bacterium]